MGDGILQLKIDSDVRYGDFWREGGTGMLGVAVSSRSEFLRGILRREVEL